MTRSGARASLLATALISTATAAAASPWPREEGRLFIAAKTNYFKSTGDEAPVGGGGAPVFERFDGDVYAEYGLLHGVTLGAKIVYGHARFYDGFFESQVDGIAEIEASVQYAVLNGQQGALSVKATGITPTRFEQGGRPGVFSDGIDAELRVLYGRGLISEPFKVYATAEAGYRRRFGDGADQIRGDVLLGLEPNRRLLVLIEAQSRFSLRNEKPGGADYDVLILQPSLVWRQGQRWSVQAGVSYEAASRNLERGAGYFVSLWAEF